MLLRAGTCRTRQCQFPVACECAGVGHGRQEGQLESKVNQNELLHESLHQLWRVIAMHTIREDHI
eukprot:m.57196 g.57196  ORF g.57196 m.57196 type:complete len:65 (-) comp17060_c0_seq1:180-374(-)